MRRGTKKLRIVAAALSVVLMTGLAGCGGSKSAPATSPASSETAQGAGGEETGEKKSSEGEKMVVMAISNAWSGLNPYNASGNATDIIADQIFDRLWVTNKAGVVTPRLAESYEVAEDHTFLTVHLNKNAKFHDGEPVTADDVIFSAKLDTNPDFTSTIRDRMNYVAGTTSGGAAEDPSKLGFEKVDDSTVKIIFKEPMNELPILTMLNCYFYILPEHVFGQFTVDELNQADVWKNNLIGSGPFMLDSVIEGERIEMVANRDYFLGEPDFDRLIIRVVEGSQLLSGLMSGEIDLIAGGGLSSLPLSDWGAAKEDPNIETVSVSNFAYQAMVLNMNSEKIGNPAIRQGISTAINRQGIVDNLLEGEGEVIYAPFSDEHPFVDESKLTLPKYDPEKARQLLEEGGYDFDQVLDLIVPVGNEVRIQSTVLIQQDLEAVGVKTRITQYDFPTLMDKMKSGDYDLGMCGSGGGIEPTEPSSWINNKGTLNFPGLPDDRLMALYDEAKAVLDLDEQKAAYNRVWQKYMDEAVVAYLYSANHLLGYNKNKLANLDTDKFPQLNWAAWEWDYIEQ